MSGLPKSSFTKPKEEVNHIYLSMEEITAIKELNYTLQPITDIARDLFVIAAVTGLRVSDYKNLTTSNIKEYKSIKYLEIRTQKQVKSFIFLFILLFWIFSKSETMNSPG